jgi:hypothetical protein
MGHRYALHYIDMVTVINHINMVILDPARVGLGLGAGGVRAGRVQRPPLRSVRLATEERGNGVRQGVDGGDQPPLAHRLAPDHRRVRPAVTETVCS